MKKHSFKKLVAWALTAAMLFAESGVVSAAEIAPAEENYALLTEAELESPEESVESSEEETVPEEIPVTEEASEESDETLPEETSEEQISDNDIVLPEEDTSDGTLAEETSEILETKEAVPAQSQDGKQLLACGSDGILYSGVTYLSAATVLGFDADTREAYLEVCDEVASWKQNGEVVQDIVLFTDGDGGFGVTYFLTNALFSAEEEAGQAEQETEESVADVASGVTILRGTDASDILGEELQTSETAEATENSSLAASVAVAEESLEIDDLEQESFNTFYSNENYFSNQLTSLEKGIYNAAKAKMVKGSSNSFSFTTTTRPSLTNLCNALSAVQDTYPSSFEWVDKTADGGASTKGYYRAGVYSWQTTIKKSKHYSSGLVSSAKKQVKKLTDEAYTYAEANYPNAPTYGIIKYFDSWICANNYYNNVGLGNTEQDMKSKEYYYCHSSIGILLKGYGVCESYAMAMNRLLDEAGIPSMVVYGTGNGGGHAWNYVQMPNGSWYMLDSTWNDVGASSNGGYLLTAADSAHVATGARYTVGSNFTYPTLASSKYTAGTAENISFNQTELVLAKGKKAQLAVSGTYYSKFRYTWESSNSKVAKVDAKGNVTAVAPGTATITYKIAGKKISCTVYVYQWDTLQFSNQKTTYTYPFANADTAFNSSDLLTFSILVNQKSPTLTAATIQAKTGLAAPKATTSNDKVATVSSCTLSGNVITLKVQPVKTGSAKVNVSFGGKKATLTLKVTQNLQSGWFNALPTIEDPTYTGKAFTPKVTPSASMPKGVTYKVSYANNVNAGTATVSITGTGNYSGTLQKTFQITVRDFSKAVFASCTAAKTYNGKAQPAGTVVKWGGKTLKAGVDYEVRYNNSATVPVNAGTYTVTVVGKGNYSGVALAKAFTYTINKAPITSLKVTCPSTVKYNNGAAVTPTVTVKIGSTVISNSNYDLKYQNAAGTVVTSLTEKGKYTLTITPKGNVAATEKKPVITKVITVK